jgi:hypothetical protein
MTFRQCKAILAGCIAIAGLNTPAHAFDYKDWSKSSEAFKGGYALGVGESLISIVDTDSASSVAIARAYADCLENSSSDLLVKQIEAFVARNPSAFTQSMVIITARTYFELCKPQIDKANIKR